MDRVKEYVTYRYCDGYKIPSLSKGVVPREKDFLKGGLGKDLREGLALDVGRIGDQSLFLFPSTALAERHYNLLFCLPEEAENLAMHFDDLSHWQSTKVLEKLDMIVKTMHKQHPHVKKFIITQHIAQREPYGYYFSQTLPQMHFHIFSYSKEQDLIKEGLFEKIYRFKTKNIIDQVYKEQSTRLVYDWLSLENKSIRLDDNTSKIKVYKTTLDDYFFLDEAEELHSLFESWKKGWEVIASCFTDFESNCGGRYCLISIEESMKRIEYIFQKYMQISERGRKYINILFQNLYYNKGNKLYFKGINGTMGWIYDFESNTRECVLSPRAEVYLCDEFKNWHVIDELTHVVYKNREKYLNQELINLITEERKVGYSMVSKALAEKGEYGLLV